MKETKFKVGDTVIHFDNDNHTTNIGAVTASFGDNEYSVDESDAFDDGDMQLMFKVDPYVHEYLKTLQSHAEKTGFFED